MIPLFKVFVAPEAQQLVGQTLSSGYLAQGPQVDAFEAILREHFGNPRMVTVNSCTSAVHLALHLVKREYGLADGTEVISTPLTCAATNFPVLANRLAIRWADVEADTLNIDLADVERKLSRETRILLLVHWGGYPIDYARLADLKARYRQRFGQDLIVIEDCAHAWESYYQGGLVGTIQDNFACFSFQAIKALTCGDGGLLITPGDALVKNGGPDDFYRQARLARWFGLDRDNNLDFRSGQNIEQWGFKFHLNDLAASLGVANYPHIRGLVARHKANARWYYDQLKDVPGLSLLQRRADCDSSYWLFTIRVANRPAFVRAMESRGITVNSVHIRNDKYSALAEFQAPLPTTDRVAEEMICIPVGWWIGEAEREQIFAAIHAGW